jgi:hypothetical protein
LKCNKRSPVVVIAVVASIILGGTILAPIQFGFAAESDNNPSAVKEESEKPTTINIFNNIVNNNFNCTSSQSNQLSGSQEATAAATQENSNNSTIGIGTSQSFQESAANTIDHVCSPTSPASSGPEESPA